MERRGRGVGGGVYWLAFENLSHSFHDWHNFFYMYFMLAGLYTRPLRESGLN